MNDAHSSACPRCGHHDVAGTRFCTACGSARVVEASPPPAAPAACPRCRAAVRPGLAFCTECGLALAAAGPQAAGPPACAGCGQQLAPGLRFCTSCGTPVSSAAPAAYAPPSSPPPTAYAPAAPSAPRQGRSWPWVLVAVVLLAGVAGGGYVLLTRDDDDPSQVASDDGLSAGDSADDARPSEDTVDDPADDPAEEPDATEPTAAATTAAPPAASVTCWDGALAPNVGACSRPQGPAGLAYVFPSMADQGCETAGGSAPGRKILMKCTAYLSDGTEVTINYSQWASVSAATDHYVGKGLIATLAANGIKTFTGYTSTGVLNNAWIYEKEPYSASVYAPNRAAMTEALATVVVGRLATEVRGGAS